MDVLREREVKDSLERQLQDEQKVRGEYDMRSSVRSSSREARLQHPRDFSKIYLERISLGSRAVLVDRSRSTWRHRQDPVRFPRIVLFHVIPRLLALSLTRVVDSLQPS